MAADCPIEIWRTFRILTYPPPDIAGDGCDKKDPKGVESAVGVEDVGGTAGYTLP